MYVPEPPIQKGYFLIIGNNVIIIEAYFRKKLEKKTRQRQWVRNTNIEPS